MPPRCLQHNSGRHLPEGDRCKFFFAPLFRRHKVHCTHSSLQSHSIRHAQHQDWDLKDNCSNEVGKFCTSILITLPIIQLLCYWDWLIDWLTEWPTDRPTDWPTEGPDTRCNIARDGWIASCIHPKICCAQYCAQYCSSRISSYLCTLRATNFFVYPTICSISCNSVTQIPLFSQSNLTSKFNRWPNFRRGTFHVKRWFGLVTITEVSNLFS